MFKSLRGKWVVGINPPNIGAEILIILIEWRMRFTEIFRLTGGRGIFVLTTQQDLRILWASVFLRSALNEAGAAATARFSA